MQKISSEITATYKCEADNNISLIHTFYQQPLPCNVDQVKVFQGMNSRNEGGKELFNLVKSFGDKPTMFTDGPLPNISTKAYEEAIAKAVELLSLTGEEISVFIDKDTPSSRNCTKRNSKSFC